MVGDDRRIGVSSVLVKAVGPESVVVGAPGQVIMRHARRVTPPAPDLDNATVPDPLGTTVVSLLSRVERLEVRVTGHASEGGHFRNTAGVWESTDFSI